MSAPDDRRPPEGDPDAPEVAAGSLSERAAAAAERSAQLLHRSSNNIAASQRLLDTATGDLAQARATIAEMEAALYTNRRISMAVGVVVVRLHLDQNQAFDELARLSQSTNRKPRDVAYDIATAGRLPT